jgi:hypothetical protein
LPDIIAPEWGELGALFAGIFDPLYDALAVPRPSLRQWVNFAAAWGVLFPAWVNTPVGRALVATVPIVTPLGIGLARKRAQRARQPNAGDAGTAAADHAPAASGRNGSTAAPPSSPADAGGGAPRPRGAEPATTIDPLAVMGINPVE